MSQPLAPTDVHLWLARPGRAADDPALAGSWRALLSPDERDRQGRFAFEPRRNEDLATRALVRTVLSRYVARPPEAWRFVRNAHGRPELDPPCGLCFNLSNAAGLVACAVARRAVGVDVEPLDRGGTILDLAATVLSGCERRALDALPPPERADRALSHWTLREAYLKARGTGLSLPLQELTFEIGPGVIAARFGAALDDDPARWRFRLLDHARHRVAVATEGPVRLRAWEVVPCSAEADIELSVDEPAATATGDQACSADAKKERSSAV